MKTTLANKYRPQSFSDVVSQRSVVDILERQITTKTFKNVYLFTGGAGTGKTTLGLLLAKAINGGTGGIIEIDAATNNGTDAVKAIISESKLKSLDSEYKIYIIDECHAITQQGWIAFLKTLEEPPSKTIFIFCTTDPQKILAPALSRMQRFDLQRISQDLIISRLEYICKNESFTYELEALEYLSKLADGGMRDAIRLLEIVSGLGQNISLKSVVEVVGAVRYETMFELTNYIIDMKELEAINLISTIYQSGADLKLFIDDYLEFILDVNKYLLSNSYNSTKIPRMYDKSMKDILSLQDTRTFYSLMLDRLIVIKELLKWETHIKTSVEIQILKLCRG